MPNACVVPNCKEYYKRGRVSLHSFPKDPERRQEWESKVKVYKPHFSATDYSKICSKHFEVECFETGKFGGTWLTQEAVPTLFEFEQSESGEGCPKDSSENRKGSEDESYASCFSQNQVKAKRLCYLGDFTEDNVVESPKNAKKFFHIAKAEVDEKKKAIRAMRKKNLKLKQRAAKIVKMLQVLKEKHILREDAI